MRIGYLDGPSGVAGDMWVGALLDAGLELEALRPAVASLGLAGVSMAAERVQRAGLAATRFRVRLERPAGAPPPHRHLADIRAILGRAALPDGARTRALAVFEALAQVEAAVHGTSVDSVHFHEVGAEDTIVDVVCATLGVELLGLERLYASAVASGSGTVRCEHGTLPVPAPGALGNLLGIPVRSGGPAGERTTPTGAALLKVLVTAFEPKITWVPRAVGYGAGTRDDAGAPNVLRLTIGELRDAGAAPALWEMSCNLDTATGEQLGDLLEGLLKRGAADAFATPIHMKKGRPGHMLTALVDAARRDDVARYLLEESSTLGVRMHAVEREVLERWTEQVETALGTVRCKVARLPSGRIVRRAEDDELKRLAAAHGITRGEALARIVRELTSM